MKVIITHLKAPWPAGANVGDVVEIPGDVAPGSLVGKFVLADAEAEVAYVYAPVLPQPVLAETKIAVFGDGHGQALPSIESVNVRVEQANRAAADALQLADEARNAMESAQADALAAMQGRTDAEAALTASKAEGDQLRKKLADAEAALTAAQSSKKK